MDTNIQPIETLAGDLELINSYTRRDFSSEELFTFSVILCDNEIDRDYEAFTKEALDSLGSMYLGKTGIFDHDPKGDNQSARIYKTRVETIPNKFTSYGQPYICLKAKAYMVRSEKYNELILEIDGGIKKEVSVGCRVEKRVCSICGADLCSGYCEHSPGEEYNGSICYTRLEQPSDAYEWSFVAVPAQVGAGVVKRWRGNNELLPDAKRTAVQLVKALGEKQLTLSRQDQQTLKKYIVRLEKQAETGKDYYKELKKEVIALGYLCGGMPEEQLEAFVKKMDISELSAAREAFSKKLGPMRPQLAKKEQMENKHVNNEFRI